jgi:hypothetical protein
VESGLLLTRNVVVSHHSYEQIPLLNNDAADFHPQSLRTVTSDPRISTHCSHPPQHRDSYLLDVVVAQGTAILKLLAGEDQTLLVRGNALLVLDLGLDVVDGVARLNVEGNGLTRQGLDETVFERN